jgi:hypothetical protein
MIWKFFAVAFAVTNIAFLIHLTKKLSRVMNAQDRLNLLIEQLNTTTNELADKVSQEIETMTQDNVSQESLDRLQHVADTLRAIGNDPAKPLPGTTAPGTDGTPATTGTPGTEGAGASQGAGTEDQGTGTQTAAGQGAGTEGAGAGTDLPAGADTHDA